MKTIDLNELGHQMFLFANVVIPCPSPVTELTLLSGAVKLQKGREKARKERQKEKKREKKEKSRVDEGKKGERRHGHGKKRQHKEFSQSTRKAGDHVKTREDKSPQLEKSSLTEERDPAAVQNFCDSPDSTQNSNKRRRHESAEAISSTHGNVLRIRLPLVKPKDSAPPSSSSGRIESVPAERAPKSTGREELPSPAEQPCCSGRTHATPSEGLSRVSHKRKHSLADDAGSVDGSGCGCDLDVRRQYKRLFLNWNPPPLRTEKPESDDEDWLFGGPATARRRDGQGETGERVASKDPDLGSALCSWPPRACYLPEVGVYAMPYVVPF